MDVIAANDGEQAVQRYCNILCCQIMCRIIIWESQEATSTCRWVWSIVSNSTKTHANKAGYNMTVCSFHRPNQYHHAQIEIGNLKRQEGLFWGGEGGSRRHKAELPPTLPALASIFLTYTFPSPSNLQFARPRFHHRTFFTQLSPCNFRHGSNQIS